MTPTSNKHYLLFIKVLYTLCTESNCDYKYLQDLQAVKYIHSAGTRCSATEGVLPIIARLKLLAMLAVLRRQQSSLPAAPSLVAFQHR